jgi:hypothetical protein
MTRTSTILLTAAIVLTTAAIPAQAGGYIGIEVSNHGAGLGFGATNWSLWGSSWDSGYASVGFSSTLSGYGDWVQVDGLGRVWRPWVAADWQPFSYGRWIWTSFGWTWVAYEPWGWVPHHYGNWAYSAIGWVWTPGYAYHPGNVVWVSAGVHVGWYPCAPHGWSHSYRGYHHGWNDGYSRGYSDGWRDARYATWVPRSQVTAENIADRSVRYETATYAVARSRVATMEHAPSRTEIEGYVGRPVPESRIVERTATVDGRQLRMVRPEGQQQTVQRHGATTVGRALSPEAGRRVSSGETAHVRRQDAAFAKTDGQNPPAAGPVEARRSVGDERPGSTPRPASRPTRTEAPSPAAAAVRTTSGPEPSRQHRTESVSADSRRSAGRAQAATAATRPTEPARAAATRPPSAARTAAPKQAEPAARRQPSARSVPEATTRSGNQPQNQREKTEPAKETKPKRNRSRN